jgi:hypothetical protein
MKALTRDNIIDADDRDLEELEISEWGGSIYIGALTIGQRLTFDEKHCGPEGTFKDLKDPELVYDMLALCIKDKEGTCLFNKEDIKDLKNKNAKTIHKIFYKALHKNYVTIEKAKILKKN